MRTTTLVAIELLKQGYELAGGNPANIDKAFAMYRDDVIEDIADDIQCHTVSSDQWWMNDFQNEYELSAHIREMKG